MTNLQVLGAEAATASVYTANLMYVTVVLEC